MSTENYKIILLVEDEAIIALSQKKTLEKFGYSVLTIDSGEKAIEAVKDNSGISLILMDIDLGEGIDGTQAAEAILKEHDLPIVFLSSHTSPEVVGKTEKITSYGYVVKNLNTTVLDASIKMAFKLFDANQKIKVVKDKLEATLDALPDLLFEVGLDGYVYDYHSPHTEFMYRPASEVIGKTVNSYLPQDIAALTMGAIKEAHETGSTARAQFEMDVPAGRLWFEILVSRKASSDKEPRFMLIKRDIDERKRMEASEKASELKYRLLIDSSRDVIFCVNRAGEYQFTNKVFATAFGKQPEDFTGKTFWDVYDKPQADIRFAATSKVFETGEPNTVEVEVPLPGGTRFYLAKVSPIKGDAGKVELALVYSTDITERKRDEEKIKRLLGEKELVLKEVNHRMKNNMSLLGGILRLHADTLKDPDAIIALEDAESRIASMMELYDKLYRSSDFIDMSAANYLPALVDQIVSNFPQAASVKLEKQVDDFSLDSKKLQALGIIVNELITNIMKYAFLGKKDKSIWVSARLEGERVVVTVRDNGNGIPDSVDFKNTHGFGLMLVSELTAQLSGTIRIERGGGTKVVLEFSR